MSVIRIGSSPIKFGFGSLSSKSCSPTLRVLTGLPVSPLPHSRSPSSPRPISRVVLTPAFGLFSPSHSLSLLFSLSLSLRSRFRASLSPPASLTACLIFLLQHVQSFQ